MSITQHAHSKTFLAVHAALAAFAFALPVTAAADSIEITNSSTAGGSNSFAVSSNNSYCTGLTDCFDPLTGNSSAGVFIPGGSAPVASGGQVTVNGMPSTGQYSVVGGGVMMEDRAVTSNTVIVNSGTISGLVAGGVHGVAGGSGTVSYNKVVITGGSVVSGNNDGGYVMGGGGLGHDIFNNEVHISSGIIGGHVAGGWALVQSATVGAADVWSNTVHVTGGVISGVVNGGIAQTGEARENKVYVTGGTIVGGVIGGFVQNTSNTATSTDAMENKVTISGSNAVDIRENIVGGMVDGTSGTGAATNNVVVIDVSNGGTISGWVIGGKTEGSGAAGGSSGGVNTVSISNTGSAALTLGDTVVGGFTGTGDASYNAVTITGNVKQTSDGNIIGGYNVSGSVASYNSVTLDGFQTSSHVFGGYIVTGSGAATYNTVNIEGATRVISAYGGRGGSGDVFTGNTLNLGNSATLSASMVGNFQTIALGNGATLTSGGSVTLGNGTATTGASGTTTIEVATGSATVGATLTGGSLVVTGGGKLVLTNTQNSGYDTTTVSGGVLAISSDANLGSGVNTLANGTLELLGSAYTKGWTLADDTENVIEATVSGVTTTFGGLLDGSGGLTLTGAGKLSFTNARADIAADLTIEDGTTYVISATSNGILKDGFSDGSERVLNGGTLEFANSGTYEADWEFRGGNDVSTAAQSFIRATGEKNVVLTGTYELPAPNGYVDLLIDSTTVNGHQALITFADDLKNNNGFHIEVGTPVYLSNPEATYSYRHTTVKDTGIAVNVPQEIAQGGTGTDAWSWGLTLGAGVTLTNDVLTLEDGAKITGLAGARYIVKETVYLDGKALVTGPTSGDAPFRLIVGNAAQPAKLYVNIDDRLEGENYALDVKNDAIVDVTGVKVIVDSDNPVSVLKNLFDPDDIEAGKIVGYNPNNLLAPVGALTGYGADGTLKADPQYKAVSEGVLGGAALVNQGGDVAAEKGVASAVAVAQGGGIGQSFGAVGGGQVKHKTGSHVDVSGLSLVAGFAAGLDGGATVGAFIEYGNGNYDSYNKAESFSSGRVKVKGSGDSEYVGLGLLGRLDLPKTATGQPYLEATARFGRAKSDFKTNDFRDYDGARRSSEYDTRSNYHGLSLGGGHVWNVGQDGAFDLYGRYIWTRQAGDSVTVKFSGGDSDRVKFSAVDSHRVRAGARYTKALGSANRFYVGAAWEHEFDGEANAKVRTEAGSAKIEAPEMKGSTGIAEVGFVFTPARNLSIDLGIQGYGGKRSGATGSAQLKYKF